MISSTNNYDNLKGYKRFIGVFLVLLALYIVAEMNRTRPVNWTVTLASEDKNPFGGYIVYRQLKDLFPGISVRSYRLPVYNQINNFIDSNTAYVLIGPELILSKGDVQELFDYVLQGNYVFMAAGNFSKALMDTLHFETSRRFNLVNDDSITINLKNPQLHSGKNYGFRQMAIDGYISKFDTSRSVVLGNNQMNDVNFIKMPYGNGAFFIHVLPLCFSNYFMVSGSNAEYAAKALSYLPFDVSAIFWDEYYKHSADGTENPLRFILNNPWLKWAFRTGLAAIILFVLFEMKRRQRIIPVIAPPGNSTLDFVQTVGNVYFNRHDNKNIAAKKISYFLEFIRSEFFLSTSNLNPEFERALAKKSGIEEQEITRLISLINAIESDASITDETLLQLNKEIDGFYNKCK